MDRSLKPASVSDTIFARQSPMLMKNLTCLFSKCSVGAANWAEHKKFVHATRVCWNFIIKFRMMKMFMQSCTSLYWEKERGRAHAKSHRWGFRSYIVAVCWGNVYYTYYTNIRIQLRYIETVLRQHTIRWGCRLTGIKYVCVCSYRMNNVRLYCVSNIDERRENEEVW